MKKFKWLLLLLGFALPYVVIYRAFFMPGPLAWGDAPFFYPENLKELFNQPFLWNFKDNNFGAPQYYILWLYIPTFLYGLLNHLLGLGNDFLIRLIFYFPATVLAFIGSFKLIGKFNRNIEGRFLGSFLYGLNTYFLMLLDGGQVGVALAYGIFPFSAYYLLNYLSRLNIRNFILALVSLFALASTDVRLVVVLVLFVGAIGGVGGITGVRERLGKILAGLSVLGLAVLGLSAYWIIPTFFSGPGGLEGLGGLGEGINFISLADALFLFQPHFPLNQFGTILSIPFYFALLPLLIFSSLLFTAKQEGLNKKNIVFGFSFIFLIFVFIAKGGSEPGGGIYLWLLGHIPLGVALRDPSKFYIPLLALAGILLSFTLSGLKDFVLGKRYLLAVILIYGYLLWLVHPALLGSLTGVLGGKVAGRDWQVISLKLQSEPGFFRTLWFDERPPTVFANWDKPALSANALYHDRPFASVTVGKYDLFNFLYSPQIVDWLNLLGVKYLFFPGNERIKIRTAEELADREKFLQFVGTVPGFVKVDWPVSFPVYKVANTKPHIFAQKKVYLVLGGEEIYRHLMTEKNFSLLNQGFVYLEDGRVDPKMLAKIASSDAEVVMEGKDMSDLAMVYLKDYMVPVSKAVENEWHLAASSDYLNWKYDLLKQGVESYEFDYGKGVASSTIAGEKIKFKLDVLQSGNYYLAFRYTNASSSAGLKVTLQNGEETLVSHHPEQFKWGIIGPRKLERGSLLLTVTNPAGFAVLNTLALVPEAEMKKARDQALDLTGRFTTLQIDDEQGWHLFAANLKDEVLPVSYKAINPTKYEIDNLPAGTKWLVFSDHYHPGWTINGANQTINLPFYAMVNGLYISGSPGNPDLIFAPQAKVNYGIMVSLVSFVAVSIGTFAGLLFRTKL